MNPQRKLFIYFQGWREGAYQKAIDYGSKTKEEIEIYDKGYMDGRLARGNAMLEAAKEFGASVNMLRAWRARP